MNTYKVLILAFLLVLPLQGIAQIKDKAGTSGFQFLKIGVGARETALAEATTAVVEGPASIYWNIAGLANTNTVSALFFHNPWIASIRHSFIAISVPVSDGRTIGAAVTLLNMDDMEETTIENPEGTGRHFGAGDFAASFSYAQQISDQLAAGVAVKYVNEYIWDLVTDGWAFDIGLQYKIDRFSLGMALKDFGTNKMIGGNQLEDYQKIYEDWETSSVLVGLVPKEIRLPVSFHFGAAYEVLSGEDHRLLTMANMVYFNDIGEVQNVGVEYTFLSSFVLRGGYRFNRDTFSFTGGIGLKTSIESTILQLNFATMQMKDFGYRTQFDIAISL